MLDARYWMLDAGCSMHSSISRITGIVRGWKSSIFNLTGYIENFVDSIKLKFYSLNLMFRYSVPICWLII